MTEDAKTTFDFYNNKLYKFKIYVLPNNRTGIYIKLHHIIADAWVCKILLKQFNNMYNNFNKERQTVEMFVSTIPLKIKINGDDTVEELVTRISIDIKNALKHQRYPYSRMLEYEKKQNILVLINDETIVINIKK